MAFAVVAIHDNALFFRECPFPTIYYWFILTGVPFFFLSSGFLVGKRLAGMTQLEKSCYLRQKAINFLRLFGIWLLIYIPFSVVEFFRADETTVHFLYRYFGGIFINGESFFAYPIWYLYASFWAYFILSLPKDLNKALPKIGGFFLVVFLVGILFPYFIHDKIFSSLLWGVTHRILGGGIYIFLGIYFSKSKIHWGVGLLCLVLSAGVYTFNPDLSALLSGVSFLLLALNMRLSYSPIYSILNTQSVWIYFTHMYLLVPIYLCCPLIMHNVNPYVGLFVTFAGVFILTAILMWLGDNIKIFNFLPKLIR